MPGTLADVVTRRKLFGAAGSTGIIAAGLTACGPGAGTSGGQPPSGQPGGKVVLMSQGTDPADQERYQPLVETYNARGGPVTIELIQGDAAGGATGAQAKLIALTAAGTAPDVFWNHASVAPNLIKLRLLAPITPYVKRDKDFKLDSLFEAPIKNYEAQDVLYGLPREATTTIMVLNKELMQKNGVPMPSPSWTWDDFLKLVQQLTRDTGGESTFGAAGWAGSGSAVYYPWIKVWQEGGDVVDSTRTKFTLHQSPAIEQVQWIADLVTRHRVNPYGEAFPGRNLQEAWNAGRLGTVVQYSVYNTFNKAPFEWDIAPMPRGKSRSTRTASAGHSMTAGSKIKDAAWEVLKYLGSKPAYEHWARLGLTLPAHKEVANGPLVLDPQLPPKSAKVALEAFEYARAEPVSGDWTAVQSEIGKAMNEVFAGTAEARTALSAIAPTVEALLSKTPESPA
ncbi:MAG TPA: sugar ABC transporter substrate-binding protein [Chloroflexota bacterium]|nr:sugar ABC transporter substrate-binding protein [Chloroflexota bacterium]